jgi:hypothetical protein
MQPAHIAGVLGPTQVPPLPPELELLPEPPPDPPPLDEPLEEPLDDPLDEPLEEPPEDPLDPSLPDPESVPASTAPASPSPDRMLTAPPQRAVRARTAINPNHPGQRTWARIPALSLPGGR